MGSKIPPAPGQGPLNEMQFQEVRQAAGARRFVRSASRTARSSGIVTLSLGVLSLLVVLFSFSALGLVVSAGVVAVGIVELVGSRRMQRADPSAAGMLGFNQLALLGLILGYCIIQVAMFSSKEARQAALSPEVRQELSAMPDMERSIDSMVDTWAPRVTYAFYGLVVLLSAGMQGGMAAYYFTRRRRVAAFNQTPAWIRRLLVDGDV